MAGWMDIELMALNTRLHTIPMFYSTHHRSAFYALSIKIILRKEKHASLVKLPKLLPLNLVVPITKV